MSEDEEPQPQEPAAVQLNPKWYAHPSADRRVNRSVAFTQTQSPFRPQGLREKVRQGL